MDQSATRAWIEENLLVVKNWHQVVRGIDPSRLDRSDRRNSLVTKPPCATMKKKVANRAFVSAARTGHSAAQTRSPPAPPAAAAAHRRW